MALFRYVQEATEVMILKSQFGQITELIRYLGNMKSISVLTGFNTYSTQLDRGILCLPKQPSTDQTLGMRARVSHLSARCREALGGVWNKNKQKDFATFRFNYQTRYIVKFTA
jgi:hypothetical protein